jgi:hypothetical protein
MNNYRTSRASPITPPTLPGTWSVFYPYFSPKGIELVVSAKNNTRDTYLHYSTGTWDGARQSCHTLYDDGNTRFTENLNNYVISHYENIGGVVTEVIRMKVSHYDPALLSIVFIVEKTSPQYPVNIRSME